MFREFPSKRDALLLAGLHLLASLCFLLSRASGTSSALVGLPLDDSWIHLVYARSLAEHLAFQYNPGQWEAGMTSPLWCILAAPLVRIALWTGLPAPLTTKLLGIATAWATSLLMFAVARRLTGSRWAAFGAAVLPALEADLAFARVSGMEVWLAGLLLVASLLFAIRDQWRAAGIAVGLGIWARPEIALWALVLPASIVIARWNVTKPSVRDALSYAVPIVLAAAAFSGYCMAATGRPLPNTFYAKWAPVEEYEIRAWWDGIYVNFLRGSSFFRWGGWLLLLAGAASIASRANQTALERRTAIGALVALIGFPIVFALAESRSYYFFAPSPVFALHRYYLPPTILLHLIAGIAAGLLLEGLARRKAARAARKAPLIPFGLLGSAIGAIGLLLALAGSPARWISRVWLYSWNTRNIEDLQVRTGRWLAKETAPGSVLALNDAGAIRYLSNRAAVDLMGLNTHELAGVEGIPASTWKLLEARRVEWVVVLSFWFPQFAKMPAVTQEADFRAEHYTLKLNSGWDHMLVYHAAGGVRAEMAVPAFLEEADRLTKRGAWDLAEEQVESALACAPADTAALSRKAALMAARERATSQLAELSARVSSVSAVNVADAATASDLAYRLGDLARSESLYQAAFRAAGGSDRLRLVTTRAQLLAQHKKGTAALHVLESAARVDPNPLLLVQIGKLALRAERYAKAERALREAIKRATDTETRTLAILTLAELAISSESRGLALEARSLLVNVPLDPTNRARMEEGLRSITSMEHDWL